MIISLSIVLLIVVAVVVYMQHPKFGKAPSGKRLERVQKSPNYSDGQFQNIHHTPSLSEGYSMWKVMYDFFFTNFERTSPSGRIPSVKTNLKNLPLTENVLVWFGHSSYFIQIEGTRFLIDPVFSGNASPIPNSTKSFNGSDAYTPADMPDIDYLLITHDHYDHLDYETITALTPKVKQVICGLGVGAHFEHWKFNPSIIHEKDWNEEVKLNNNITLHTTSARHFSGRSLSRNNTLWMSYVLTSPTLKLFLGGDSGYDSHFKEIGAKFGGFDLAILENGQYNPAWHEIHLLPEEVLMAASDLHTRMLLPVHSSKFKLAFHAWDEPLNLVNSINRTKYHVPLATPIIGEVVRLNDPSQTFSPWWQGVE